MHQHACARNTPLKTLLHPLPLFVLLMFFGACLGQDPAADEDANGQLDEKPVEPKDYETYLAKINYSIIS